MNPRQRRAVLLLALAVAGLIGVFALVANYVSEIETQVGDKIVVLELTKPASANEAISDDMVVEKFVPKQLGAGRRAARPHAADRRRRRGRPGAQLGPAGGHARHAARDQRGRARGRDPGRRRHRRGRQDRAGPPGRRDRVLRRRGGRPRRRAQGQARSLDRDRPRRARDRRRPAAREAGQQRSGRPAGPGPGGPGHVRADQASGAAGRARPGLRRRRPARAAAPRRSGRAHARRDDLPRRGSEEGRRGSHG